MTSAQPDPLSDDTEPPEPLDPTRDLFQVEPGSVTAKALYEIWSGSRTVVVNSPPGAGKSRLVATIAAHLAVRSGLSVVVATSTRNQAEDISWRIAEQMDPANVVLGLSGSLPEIVLDGRGAVNTRLKSRATPKPGIVVIKTVAGCDNSQPEADVMIVDEAYQSTFAAVAVGADRCGQLLLVGDPGQIGPVITIDTSEWDRMSAAPHKRSPDVFSQRPEAIILNLDSTYRFGLETVKAIAPLYNFDFGSNRSARCIVGFDEIEPVRSPWADDPFRVELMELVAARAASFVGQTLRAEGDSDRTIEPSDIAVIASRNVQVASLRALCNGLDLADVTVGTADGLQGGQWEVVVAIDPLIGSADGGASEFALTPGRLCVMASRHRSHLTWVHDKRWVQVLESTSADNKTLHAHASVRQALTG